VVAVSPTPTYDLSERIYPAGLRLRFGEQGDAYFCFLLDGALSEGRTTYSTEELIFLPADQNHVVEVAQACRCFIVRVGPGLLSRIRMSSPELRETVRLKAWEAVWLVKRLHTEFVKGAPAPSLRIEAIILQLLALAARIAQEKEVGRAPRWLRRVREVIDDHHLSEYRLSELASLAGVHRVHLVREFRKHYGTTIGEHMRKLRLDHASQLLRQTNLPLREIAAECRFADQSHFTKRFKKLSGLTPAEYRNLFQTIAIDSRPSVHDKKLGQHLHIRIGE
jgi:AraC family transcriptional regulator